MANDNRTVYKDDDNTTSAPKVVITHSDKTHTGTDANGNEVRSESAAHVTPNNPQDSYEGRKHEPKIDGPQQDSQETDEVYADPRQEENLPAGGKKVDELNVDNLGRE